MLEDENIDFDYEEGFEEEPVLSVSRNTSANNSKEAEPLTNHELFKRIYSTFESQKTPELEFLDAAFSFIRTTTEFFSLPNMVGIKAKLDNQMEVQKKEMIHKIQKKAQIEKTLEPEVEDPIGTEPSTPFTKKKLGENAMSKLQDLCIERLSGETEPVPINNLLQSLSQEYDIPKETYNKKWQRWLGMQDFLVLDTDTNLVSLLPEYNTGAEKNTRFPILPDTRTKKKKPKKTPLFNPSSKKQNNNSRGDDWTLYPPQNAGGPRRGRGGFQASYPYHPYAVNPANVYPYNSGPPAWGPRGGYGGFRGRSRGRGRGRGRGRRGRGRRGRGRKF